MRYLRCQCGKAKRWDTGEAVRPCEGCAECKTTYATAPEYHKPLADHALVTVYDEYTREPKGQECTVCHRRVKA